MDAFGYFAADAAHVLGNNIDVRRDGFSPERREMRELVTVLRRRYGRRRLFRIADVESAIREIRYGPDYAGEVTPRYRIIFELPQQATVRRPVIDLTSIDDIID